MPDDTEIRNVTLRDLLSKYRLVIPEIQREYVWGNAVIGSDVLRGFYNDLLKGFEHYLMYDQEVEKKQREIQDAIAKVGITNEKKLREMAEDEVSAEGVDTNVGFLYAYLPEYVNARESQNFPAFLIDGQQRVTTLCLVWLYLARISNRMDDFLRIMRRRNSQRYNPELSFDFKVRQKTRSFFYELVNEVESNACFDFASIEDATWFLAEYSSDVTVKAMVNALVTWDSLWKETVVRKPFVELKANECANKGYDYLSEHLLFWLFIVKNTVQGEQLYITMNGRGKSLTPAEIIRARVFQGVDADLADDVGRTFEGIYDFFWTHPIEGELTADAGVQKFFRWVYLLDRYERSRREDKTLYTANENSVEIQEFRAALQNQVRGETRVFELKDSMFDPQTGIGYPLIKRTFEALKELVRLAEDPSVQYNGVKLNDYMPDSLLRTRADDSQKFQRDTLWVLPLLRWLSNQNDSAQSSSREKNYEELIRFARYLKNQRSVDSVKKSINAVVANAVCFADLLTSSDVGVMPLNDCLRSYRDLISESLIPEEEIFKLRLLDSADNNHDLRKRLETLMWKIEDFKRDGEESEFDYRISGILTSCDQSWFHDSIILNDAFVDRLQNIWAQYNSFIELQKTHPDWIAEWSLYPNHQGYYEYNERLVPFTHQEILEKPYLLIAIQKLMCSLSPAEDKGVCPFIEERTDFLKQYWPERNEIADPLILAALAVVIGALNGDSGIKPGWTQLEFKNDIPEEEKYEGQYYCIGAGDNKKIFWLRRTSQQRRARVLPECYILPYHTLSPTDVDDLVNKSTK